MIELTDARGNLISRAEKIKELGAKTSKSFSQAIFNRALEDSEE